MKNIKDVRISDAYPSRVMYNSSEASLSRTTIQVIATTLETIAKPWATKNKIQW